jgi:DNA-binding protein YbaB
MVDEIYRAWNRLASIDETAESRDGNVAATVGPSGELRSLVLDPRVYRAADAEALAGDILDTIAEAVRLARRRAFNVVAPLLARDATLEDTDLAFDPVLRNLGRRGLTGRN